MKASWKKMVEWCRANGMKEGLRRRENYKCARNGKYRGSRFRGFSIGQAIKRRRWFNIRLVRFGDTRRHLSALFSRGKHDSVLILTIVRERSLSGSSAIFRYSFCAFESSIRSVRFISEDSLRIENPTSNWLTGMTRISFRFRYLYVDVKTELNGHDGR